MDLIVRANKIPNGGETILGDEFYLIPGGKGANQAVAVSRLGGTVSMVAKIGADSFGETLREQLISDHVDVKYVMTEKNTTTGVAFIIVEKSGENRIIVVSGANYTLSEEDLLKAEALLSQAKVVITQFEIPLPTIEYLIDSSKKNGFVIVVNAAPARKIPDIILSKIDYLIVNESEASYLSDVLVQDINSASQAARALVARGAPCVVLTLGPMGSLVCSVEEEHFIPKFEVEVIDTTGAGDAFIGGFAISLLQPDLSLSDRVIFGNAAGALATTKLGAQSSLPVLADVRSLLASRKITLITNQDAQ